MNYRGFKIENGKIVEKRFCRYCRATNDLTIDHKVPKSKGGKDELKNYQCLCRSCNEMKSSLTDRRVRGLFVWFYEINQKRALLGKKPLGQRKKKSTPTPL